MAKEIQFCLVYYDIEDEEGHLCFTHAAKRAVNADAPIIPLILPLADARPCNDCDAPPEVQFLTIEDDS